MKRTIVLTTIFATIAVLGMSVSSPVIAHDSLQSAKTSTPVVTKTPVKQPAPQTSPQSVLPYRSTIVVKDDGTSSPVAVISSNEPRTLPITMTMKTMQWTGAPLPKDRTFAPTHPMRTPKAGELVDNWEQIFNDGFETVFPYTPFCVLRDMRNDGFERVWGKDSLHVFGGNSAIWPARGDVDGVNPATNFYPSNMESRLVCGPFDITNYQTIMTRYMRWMDIDDPNDKFWWGYSTDGTWFYWLDWTGVANYWVEQSVYLDLPSGKSQVWIVLAFSSDGMCQ